MSLLFLLLLGRGLGLSEGPALSGTVHQGKPEGCAGSFSGDHSSADHKKPGGRACAAGAAPGRGEGGEGRSDLGWREGGGAPWGRG